MYRWVCFEENYSMITKFQPFPHSVFRMGVSQVCQFFQFYVWKFCRFQIAHLRRFRACWVNVFLGQHLLGQRPLGERPFGHAPMGKKPLGKRLLGGDDVW